MAWKARGIANRTMSLPAEGEGFVDRHVAPVAHTLSGRAWTGSPSSSAAGWPAPRVTVTIKPVIDLRGRVHVEAYQVPDRIKDHVDLRDHHWVFPHCGRRAVRCQKDHAVPHARGGPTSTRNIAPLCPRPHRPQTHGGWTYTMPTPGTCIWTSPHGLQFLVDPRGTHDINATDPPHHTARTADPPDQ